MSVMAFRAKSERKQVALSVTPLIDVLFLLVIFFMVTGTFKRLGELELQLPGSTTSTPTVEEERVHEVELLVTVDGRLTLNGKEVELRELKGRLRGILRRDPSSRVMIKAEKSVEHGQVVLLLDIVRDAGFLGVGIGTYIESAPEGKP